MSTSHKNFHFPVSLYRRERYEPTGKWGTMIGTLGELDSLFGLSKDSTFELLLSVEVLFEPDFGTKQPKKNSKIRDMNIG